MSIYACPRCGLRREATKPTVLCTDCRYVESYVEPEKPEEWARFEMFLTALLQVPRSQIIEMDTRHRLATTNPRRRKP